MKTHGTPFYIDIETIPGQHPNVLATLKAEADEEKANIKAPGNYNPFRKPEAAKVEVEVELVGFDIPNEFVVGYGLDYAENYRTLPGVAILSPSVYS